MIITLLSITPNSEELIENAARTCYQSKSNEKTNIGDLIRKLIKSNHHSVLEHVYAVFKIKDCSRAMTHQLVRHRLCSFSQQSQRYVKENQFNYVIPPEIYNLKDPNNPNINYVSLYKQQMEHIQQMYNFWKNVGLKNEDARFVLPNACCTEIVIGANFREWRHIIEVRCDKHAQWEIKNCITEILKILFNEAPSVFEDLKEKFI